MSLNSDLRCKFSNFVNKQLEKRNPDYIELLERRGRIFDYLNIVPKRYQDRVRYSSFFRFISPEKLEGKRVVVLDDSAQHGRSLYVERTFLEEKGAVVTTLCLIKRKSPPEPFLDPDAVACLELNDQEFVNVNWAMQNYLQANGRTLDVDHPERIIQD